MLTEAGVHRIVLTRPQLDDGGAGVSHAGAFPELEDEICAGIGKGRKSPDRLDALVWAVSDLMLRRRVEPRIRIL